MAVETVINYFDLSNERVFYPGTAGYQRRKFDTKSTIINDLRGREQDFTLDKNGFQVIKGHWSEEDVNDEPDHIKNVVFPEVIERVKQVYVLLHRYVYIDLLKLISLANQIRSYRRAPFFTPHPPPLGQRREEAG